MAEGNPRLAVWESTGTVRTYEYSGGAFVQLAALAGFTHTPSAHPAGIALYPKLAWAQDGRYISIRRAIGTGTSRLQVLNEYLDQKGTMDGQNTSGDASAGLMTFDHANDVSILHPRLSGPYQNSIAVNLNGTAVVLGTAPVDLAGNNERAFEAAPDGTMLVSGQVKPTDSRLYRRGAYPAFETPEAFVSRGIDVAGWSPDSEFLITGSAADMIVQVFKIIDGAPVLMMELPPEGKVPVAIALSPDYRGLAVGYLSGGAYSTVVYRRSGDFYIKKQTLTGIGQLLDYSGSGKLLVDAAQRKAYAFDGTTMTLVAGAVDAIPLGMVQQAMSPHVVNPDGQGTLYHNVIDKLLDDIIDLETLKITLLSGDAVFDPTHTTLAEVTGSGAFEIADGGWPAGGLLVTGVVKVADADRVLLKSDPIMRVITGSALTARYAVVYDASAVDETPVAFIDFLADKTIAKNTELVLSFRSGNLIAFGS